MPPCFTTCVPAPPLDHLIHLLWHWREAEPRPHAKERILPDGGMALIINLAEDRDRIYDRDDPTKFTQFPGTMLTGVQSEHFVIDTESQRHVAGVHFRPGGAFPFFEAPAGELANHHLPLADLWGPWAAELRERLLAAATPEGVLELLERALLARLVRSPERHPAVAYALRELSASPMQRVSRVIDALGLSQRRFIELFTGEVGLTPKLFSRIRRFQAVIFSVQRRAEPDWADVALACGYYDQAHFIHDFKAFSGLTPSRYLQHRSEHLNHVPLL